MKAYQSIASPLRGAILEGTVIGFLLDSWNNTDEIAQATLEKNDSRIFELSAGTGPRHPVGKGHSWLGAKEGGVNCPLSTCGWRHLASNSVADWVISQTLKWANDGSILIGVNQSYCHRSRVFCYNLLFGKCAKYIMGTFLLVTTLPETWGINRWYWEWFFFLDILTKTSPFNSPIYTFYLRFPRNVESTNLEAQDSLLALAVSYPITIYLSPCTGPEIKYVLNKWLLNEINWENYCT